MKTLKYFSSILLTATSILFTSCEPDEEELTSSNQPSSTDSCYLTYSVNGGLSKTLNDCDPTASLSWQLMNEFQANNPALSSGLCRTGMLFWDKINPNGVSSEDGQLHFDIVLPLDKSDVDTMQIARRFMLAHCGYGDAGGDTNLGSIKIGGYDLERNYYNGGASTNSTNIADTSYFFNKITSISHVGDEETVFGIPTTKFEIEGNYCIRVSNQSAGGDIDTLTGDYRLKVFVINE